MGKYLYITGGGTVDYAALTFEQDYKGDRLELWNRANEKGMQEVDEDDMYFTYEAYELDDATVEKMKENMDYDDSKHSNYYKVEEK